MITVKKRFGKAGIAFFLAAVTMSGYRRQDWLTNIPLYAACGIKQSGETNEKGVKENRPR